MKTLWCLDDSPSSTDVQSEIQERFKKTWERLKRIQIQNIQFEREFDRVVDVYCDQVLPKERELLLEPSQRLIEHLIGFIPRKTLPDWQRDELLDWIDRLISNVSRLDSVLADELRAKVILSLEAFAGGLESGTEFNMADVVRVLEEQWESEKEAESEAGGKTQDQEKANQDSKFKSGDFEKESLVETPWLVQLFRKTAQALHPDREQNLEAQKLKAQLITRLIQARKDGDVMTIIELYSDHVSGMPALKENEMEQVIRLIELQIRKAKQDREALICRNPERAFAYDIIYAKTKKQQQQKIQNAITHFHELRESMVYCRRHIKSLKTLGHFFKSDSIY